MYYTADLTTISRSILEAATIDGAGMKDQLLLIIFPVLKNTHKTIILSMLLGGFREMERVYLMTDGCEAEALRLSEPIFIVLHDQRDQI